MVTPAEAAVSTLSSLAEELRKRQTDVETLDCAYRGDFKLHYASTNFRDFFADRYAKFSDNWCGIVADAPHERLEVTGIRLSGQENGDGPLFDAWRATDSDANSDLAMLDAIIAKRSFAIVWGDGDDEPRISWEHPSQCIVAYDPETRERVAGAKIWCDDEREFGTLYLKDAVWKFQRDRAQHSRLVLPASVSATGEWTMRQPDSDDKWPLDNPLGKVAMVELRNRPRLMGEPHSDISGTLAMQHAINLFWAQLFAVSDEATLGQRLIIGGEAPMVPILNETGDVVGEKPMDLKKFRHDSIAFITGDGKPHQWTPAKLDVFTEVIEVMVGHIAAQTRTPAHYLMIGGTIANVSGDAMKALETGLVQRTQEKTQHFGRAIRDVFELVALVQDDSSKAARVRGGQVLWADVENRSDAQTADAAVKDKTIGLPLRYILERRYNLSPTEIDRVMQMREDEMSDPALTAALKTLQDPNVPAAPAPPVE